MAELPVLVSLVALMVAEPGTTPVTRPLLRTVATAGALPDQVTRRPVGGLPALSLGGAVGCTVAPTGTLAAAGLTVTDAAGTLVIVTAAVSAGAPPLCVAITR